MNNALRLAAVFAAVAALQACSGGSGAPAKAPLNCEKGTHQEGGKCVLNAPVAVPAKAAK